MSIEIVNAHDDATYIERYEYVGRRPRGRRGPHSPLANPYKVGRDGDRHIVIEKYEQWLWAKINGGDRLVLDELARLGSIVERTGGVTLVCWCKPLPCHADVIKRILERILREEGA